jgi:7,8-dihydropterin-6-yl-methyl-4-(beta-D-ribofuranosyl)aminobenzene 5'-phosphate synthase
MAAISANELLNLKILFTRRLIMPITRHSTFLPTSLAGVIKSIVACLLLFVIIAGCRKNEELIKQEIKKKPELAIVFDYFGVDPSELLERFNKGKLKAEQEWQLNQSNIRKIKDLGLTKTLEILPLIDWYTCNEYLKGEAGVSYLIKTDKVTILFDVGLNSDQIDPSPLLHNMKQLGITLDDFDAIVISHNHIDHVGGEKWCNQQTFSLTNYQLDLGRKSVYTPIPMTYPGLSPVCTENPTVISEGVTTIGVISNQLFFLGYTSEQALAINVKGKGIVIIVGCGHQTLPKILERADTLFDEPIYGIIGGLHYPVNYSRSWVVKGIKFLNYVGTGKEPWNPVTIEDVQNNIDLLKKRNPNIVGLSGHDSCDDSIEEFRKAFPGIYKDIKVGEKITISKNE